MIEIEEDKFGRLQKISKIVASVCLAVFIILLGLGIWKSIEISQEITAKNNELALKQKAIDENAKQILEQENVMKTNNEQIEIQKKLLSDYALKSSNHVNNEVLGKE